MIATRHPADLKPHWAIEAMPRWEHHTPEWLGFIADIEENGIRHPIQITADNLVVDGETRRQAAIELGLAEVPVILVPDTEIFEAVLREIRRRHMTKSAMAYVAFPLFREAYEELIAKGRAKRISNLRIDENPNVSRKPTESVIGAGRVEDLANSIGVSADLLQQAARLHELFHLDPEYRAAVEPGILSGDIGLGAAIAGHAGREATLGRTRPETKHLGLIKRGCSSWTKWGGYWEHLDPYEQQDAITTVRSSLQHLPSALLIAMRDELWRLSQPQPTQQ